MQKVDLDSMSIEELAKLRDHASDKLAEKIAARQRELAAELEKLSAFGKKAKAAAPKKDMPKPQAQPQVVKAA